MLLTELQTIQARDPAAHNWLEVLFCYSGFHALLLHRLAYGLYCLKIPVIPRLISHLSRFLTGVEIHPGAKISKNVFIDHGIGVVIGETAIVGEDAVIYQGATLGGTGKEIGKRHPTLGKNVVVGAGAKVLGNIKIGDNVRIGAGAVVLKDVPSNHTVVGVPGRLVYQDSTTANLLQSDFQPDVEAQIIRALFERIQALEGEIERLQPPLKRSEPYSEKRTMSPQIQASNRVIEDFLEGAGI